MGFRCAFSPLPFSFPSEFYPYIYTPHYYHQILGRFYLALVLSERNCMDKFYAPLENLFCSLVPVFVHE